MSSQGQTSLFTRLLVIVSWAIAIALVAFAGYLGWKVLRESRQEQAGQVAVASAPEQPQQAAAEPASLPAVQLSSQVRDIYRKALSHTTIPERPSEETRTYTVSTGDSVFEIAAKFKIKPETLLWANYDQLNDNPDTIGLGMDAEHPTGGWRLLPVAEGRYRLRQSPGASKPRWTISSAGLAITPT